MLRICRLITRGICGYDNFKYRAFNVFQDRVKQRTWCELLFHLFAHSNVHILLLSSQEQMLSNQMALLSVELLNSVSFQKTRSIIWMWLELNHSTCTTSLIASLNASAILWAFLLTSLPPKEKMENFGAICCHLISTETSESTMKTWLRITFSLW